VIMLMARDRGTLVVEQPEDNVMVGDRLTTRNGLCSLVIKKGRFLEITTSFFLPSHLESSPLFAKPYHKNPPESQQEDKRCN
jgi:hypothetical protein